MARSGRALVGSRYVDQRHFVVAPSLAVLCGPTHGVVRLDPSLDWSGDARYDLDDPGDLQMMYQTVLNQATSVDELCRWLDGGILRGVWGHLWLPARLRALWHARIPELPVPPRMLAG